MRTAFTPAVALAALLAALSTPVLAAQPAAAASSQVVTFAVADAFCPAHGLYGISHVSVASDSGMVAEQNFSWNTRAAATSIDLVPPEGGAATVTVSYHCNVKVLWWYEAGPRRAVTGSSWVNGAGPQPTYTFVP